MNENALKFLQKNYGWIATFATGGIVGISFIIRLSEYIFSVYYFEYYGLSYEFYNENGTTLFYSFSISTLLILCIFALIYCYIQIFNIKKYSNKLKIVLINLFLIIISNMIIISLLNIKYSILQFFMAMFVLIIIEIITTFITLKIVKNDAQIEYDKHYRKNLLKLFPFQIFLTLACFLFLYDIELKGIKTYRIIGDDKVIVYTTNDYYLTLNCSINNKSIDIQKGTQTKVMNTNIESKVVKFNRVSLR